MSGIISTRGASVHQAIANRTPFRTHGALSADASAYSGTGVLPEPYVTALRNERPEYVVYSYSTPIAWWSEAHGWTIPAVKYSATTSRHQSTARIATTL